MNTLKAKTCFLMMDNKSLKKPLETSLNRSKSDKENISSPQAQIKKSYGHTTADVENQILDWLKEIKNGI